MKSIVLLSSLHQGDQATIKEIRAGGNLLQRLNRMGLHCGDRITVVRRGYLGGTVLIHVHGISLGIGHGMAEKIEVEVNR
ncbi:MAG: ferrous iron transport protein A [Chitinivibrionales bacterium]|nr:ferrous iron transport protein A [Chitinivibrionales bacterium]